MKKVDAITLFKVVMDAFVQNGQQKECCRTAFIILFTLHYMFLLSQIRESYNEIGEHLLPTFQKLVQLNFVIKTSVCTAPWI
jgi:hypothetical protein